MNRRRTAALIGCAGLVASACDRDTRSARYQAPPGGARAETVVQVPLVPGPPGSRTAAPNPVAGDPQALAEGKRLYGWFNCAGCHFEGGGGIGPPFLDEDWIYGSEPAQIFDSIASGRANGMPAFRDRLTAEQTWQIVAHVEALAASGGTRPEGGVEDRSSAGRGSGQAGGQAGTP